MYEYLQNSIFWSGMSSEARYNVSKVIELYAVLGWKGSVFAAQARVVLKGYQVPYSTTSNTTVQACILYLIRSNSVWGEILAFLNIYTTVVKAVSKLLLPQQPSFQT